MDLNNMNEDWKSEAPELAAMGKTNPFTVPENYFKELSEQLQARVTIEERGVKDSQQVFAVPADYFETLEDRIHTSITFQRLQENIKDDAFIVPDKYFDKLEATIIKKTLEPKPEAKVVRLIPGWIRYAAAACITAVIGVGIFINNTSNRDSIDSQLAKISDDAIVEYLQVSSNPVDAQMITESIGKNPDLGSLSSDLSDQEIEKYLESTL